MSSKEGCSRHWYKKSIWYFPPSSISHRFGWNVQLKERKRNRNTWNFGFLLFFLLMTFPCPGRFFFVLYTFYWYISFSQLVNWDEERWQTKVFHFNLQIFFFHISFSFEYCIVLLKLTVHLWMNVQKILGWNIMRSFLFGLGTHLARFTKRIFLVVGITFF